jgi:hypothetical protein
MVLTPNDASYIIVLGIVISVLPISSTRLTILLAMELRTQAEYTVVDDVKTLWEKLASS